MCASRTGLHAVILVGGQGLRLRPVTEAVPKPLLPLVEVATITLASASVRNHSNDADFAAASWHDLWLAA